MPHPKLCPTHNANLANFCLCGQNSQKSLVYLCPSCASHKGDNHEVYPIASLRLYDELGKDELKRRWNTLKKCTEFLDRVSSRENDALGNATTLITDLARHYQERLEKTLRYFNSTVGHIREEIGSLAIDHQVEFSPLAQVLVERCESLGSQEENHFCVIPKKEELTELLKHCSLSSSRSCSALQKEYEQQVLGSFSRGSSSSIHPGMPKPLLGDMEQLVAVLSDQVKWFDVATSQWQQLYALRQNISVDIYTASTFIAPNRIFVCGGGSSPCNLYADKRAYVLERGGAVLEQSNMLTSRKYHGIIWDPNAEAVYVFGGNNDSGTCLNTSEQFKSNQWLALPNMHKARQFFNPCWYSFVVYLCGGESTNSVETYDPRTNAFGLQNFSLPEGSRCTVVAEPELTVISSGYISKLQQGKITYQQHPSYLAWSNCSSVVVRGIVYIVSLENRCCRGIDIVTGVVTREVFLGN